MNDLTDELEACLDVLGEYLAWVTWFDSDDDKPGQRPPVAHPARDELRTAAWQTIELTLALLDEHADVWASLGVLRLVVTDLQAELAKTRELWTPRVALPSGQAI